MSCTEARVDVSSRIPDDVQFSSETVEFRVLLTQPNVDLVWLKDGRPLIKDTDKYSTSVDQTGLLHTLVVIDVRPSDAGVYTVNVHWRDGSLCRPVDSWSETNVETFTATATGRGQHDDLLHGRTRSPYLYH